MKKTFILFLTILMTISFSACSSSEAKEALKWDMNESQVRKIGKVSKENQTVKSDEYSWINCNDQEILGCVGKLTYNFNNSKLTDIDFTPNQINNVDEMNQIYGTLKESISLEYGNPTIDEVRESKDSDLQYHYTEWNIENTLIMLQDNEEALRVFLGFHSAEYLKTFEQSQERINTKYKTNGEWALNVPYVFAVEKEEFDGDIYCAGEYTFKTTNVSAGEAPIYDIYIEKSECNSISELGSIDYTVGGSASFPISITLNKGDYVYIVPYADLLYEPKGYLTFEIKD